MLVAVEQEEQGHQQGGRGYVAGIEQVHAGADRGQQEVDGGLHRGAHAYDGKAVVYLDEKIANDGVEQETAQAVGQGKACIG